MSDAFKILDPARINPAQRKAQLEAFETQTIPPPITNHAIAAKHFQPDEPLVLALNAALAVGAPLLVTGEPGTGKTQVAFWVAYHLGILDERDESKNRLFTFHIRSTSVALDLLYQFDAVRYFHAAQDTDRKEPLARADFVEKGPLWKAIIADKRCVVLIDEIDKAPKDFPNDLLNVLDQYSFKVREMNDKVVARHDGAPPPLVVITSNSEQRLPAPFLRRCIFHCIELTDELVHRAVAARAGDFPRLDDDTRKAAIEIFLALRRRELRKKPSISELLVWLTLLSVRGDVSAAKLQKTRPAQLPALSALIKDRDDLAAL